MAEKESGSSQSKAASADEFTGWRSIIWPIYNSELKKFLPMAFMMMGILFNYSIMRGLKDSLVVTSMGADTIPTLKLFFVLASAVLFMIAYSKLSNVFSKNTVFYTVVSFGYCRCYISEFIVCHLLLQRRRIGILNYRNQLRNLLL